MSTDPLEVFTTPHVHIDQVTCKCTGSCEFPCWQRAGIAPACDGCGCDQEDDR